MFEESLSVLKKDVKIERHPAGSTLPLFNVNLSTVLSTYLSNFLGFPFTSPTITVANPVNWEPDKTSERCSNCRNNFTVVNRRHHCRCCGVLICNTCSIFKTVPQQGYFYSTRICGGCVTRIKEEIAKCWTNWARSSFKKGSCLAVITLADRMTENGIKYADWKDFAQIVFKNYGDITATIYCLSKMRVDAKTWFEYANKSIENQKLEDFCSLVQCSSYYKLCDEKSWILYSKQLIPDSLNNIQNLKNRTMDTKEISCMHIYYSLQMKANSYLEIAQYWLEKNIFLFTAILLRAKELSPKTSSLIPFFLSQTTIKKVNPNPKQSTKAPPKSNKTENKKENEKNPPDSTSSILHNLSTSFVKFSFSCMKVYQFNFSEWIQFFLTYSDSSTSVALTFEEWAKAINFTFVTQGKTSAQIWEDILELFLPKHHENSLNCLKYIDYSTPEMYVRLATKMINCNELKVASQCLNLGNSKFGLDAIKWKKMALIFCNSKNWVEAAVCLIWSTTDGDKGVEFFREDFWENLAINEFISGERILSFLCVKFSPIPVVDFWSTTLPEAVNNNPFKEVFLLDSSLVAYCFSEKINPQNSDTLLLNICTNAMECNFPKAALDIAVYLTKSVTLKIRAHAHIIIAQCYYNFVTNRGNLENIEIVVQALDTASNCYPESISPQLYSWKKELQAKINEGKMSESEKICTEFTEFNKLQQYQQMIDIICNLYEKQNLDTLTSLTVLIANEASFPSHMLHFCSGIQKILSHDYNAGAASIFLACFDSTLLIPYAAKILSENKFQEIILKQCKKDVLLFTSGHMPLLFTSTVCDTLINMLPNLGSTNWSFFWHRRII